MTSKKESVWDAQQPQLYALFLEMAIETKNGYTVQLNIISNQYRILDNNQRRVCYSFELDYIKQRLQELAE